MRSLLFTLILVPFVVLAQQPEPVPAFAGQTDAPMAPPSGGFRLENITDRLEGPWSLAFLPSGNFLVTTRPGEMRVVRTDGSISAALENVPPVKRVAAEGLHDVVLDPDFDNNRLIYFMYFAPPKGERAE